MKRVSNIAIVAVVLLLSGCVIGHDVKTNESVELRLRAIMNNSTRSDSNAEENSGFPTTFPEDTDLGLWAFSLPRDKKWGVFRPDAEPFATNEIFSRDEATGLWCPPQRLEWHYPQSLTLIGYAPYDLDIQLDGRRGLMLQGYDLLANQEQDILYTDYIADCHSEENMQCVDVPFHHALARVDFTAHTTLPDGYELKIHRISIESVATRGSFFSQPAPEWEVDATKNIMVFFESEQGWDVAENTNSHIEGSGCFVIPQLVTTHILIEAEMKHAGFVSTRQYRTEQINTRWEVGKYYTYSLNFTLDDVSLKDPSDAPE